MQALKRWIPLDTLSYQHVKAMLIKCNEINHRNYSYFNCVLVFSGPYLIHTLNLNIVITFHYIYFELNFSPYQQMS